MRQFPFFHLYSVFKIRCVSSPYTTATVAAMADGEGLGYPNSFFPPNFVSCQNTYNTQFSILTVVECIVWWYLVHSCCPATTTSANLAFQKPINYSFEIVILKVDSTIESPGEFYQMWIAGSHHRRFQIKRPQVHLGTGSFKSSWVVLTYSPGQKLLPEKEQSQND